jgi:putative Mg2+ transporter-C (MgtC) family protein
MPLVLEWPEIALRLAFAVLAGALIGFDRDEHGRPAGLRTTLLVCLAATLAMIEVNLLLGQVGKAPDSFVNLDLMRLPLGILTGVGFIGGGAILRRQDGVIGITTAASLWFVTVIGLCFGAGLIALGLAGTAMAMVILWALKWLEKFIPREHRAVLVLRAAPAAPEDDLDRALESAGIGISSRSIAYASEPPEARIEWAVRWRSRGKTAEPPRFLADFARRRDILSLEWRTQDPAR